MCVCVCMILRWLIKGRKGIENVFSQYILGRRVLLFSLFDFGTGGCSEASDDSDAASIEGEGEEEDGDVEEGGGKLTLIFFSVSFSQRRILQIWWLLSLRQGAQEAQLSLRMQPMHSPHRLRFFFDCFSPQLKSPESLDPGPLDGVIAAVGCLKPRAVLDTLGT